jgi:hypothetical protein
VVPARPPPAFWPPASNCWVSQRNTVVIWGRHSAMLWPPALRGRNTTSTAVGGFATFCRALPAS